MCVCVRARTCKIKKIKKKKKERGEHLIKGQKGKHKKQKN